MGFLGVDSKTAAGAGGENRDGKGGEVDQFCDHAEMLE
jgi:hypothetical protein